MGILRYGELRRTITGVTAKMLTQALKELEDDGLVARKVYTEVPPRVEYTITTTGSELIPAIDSMRIWAEKQLEATAL